MKVKRIHGKQSAAHCLYGLKFLFFFLGVKQNKAKLFFPFFPLWGGVFLRATRADLMVWV